MNAIRDIARNAAAAEMFALMGSEDKAQEALAAIRDLPDSALDAMGRLSDVPEAQLPIFRAIVRGQDNPLFARLSAFEHELKTGDLILMTGTSPKSKALVASQKPFYLGARSSHVAVVHADFICIDAMPDPGVSNRLVSDVLSDVESDWRVIRFAGVNDSHAEALQKACVHYITQPYKITLKRKRPKEYSYCSELARKVYEDCAILETGIPQHVVVKPCDFDRIADGGAGWVDVTSQVKPYVEFAIEYAPLLRVVAKGFIDGLKLNRSRYEERRQWLKMVETREKKGRLAPEKAAEIRAKIREIEESMNFTFWDFKKVGEAATPAAAASPQAAPHASA